MRTQLTRVLLICAAVLCLVHAPSVAVAQQEPAAAQKPTLNLNTATLDQLTALPGIGPKTAQLILEYRTKSGGFKKIEELMNVRGIGEASFLKLKALITIAATRTERAAAQ